MFREFGGMCLERCWEVQGGYLGIHFGRCLGCALDAENLNKTCESYTFSQNT